METPSTTSSQYGIGPQPQAGVWPVGAKGGLYTGLILVIFSLLSYLFEMSRDSLAGSIFTIISFCIGIYLTHQAFKDQGNGFMSYGQGLGLGAVVGMVSGFLNAIFIVIYVSFIDNTIISQQMDQVRIGLENKGLSDAEIDQGMYFAEMMASPIVLFFSVIIGSILYAFVIALIISAFTKKTDPDFEY